MRNDKLELIERIEAMPIGEPFYIHMEDGSKHLVCRYLSSHIEFSDSDDEEIVSYLQECSATNTVETINAWYTDDLDIVGISEL